VIPARGQHLSHPARRKRNKSPMYSLTTKGKRIVLTTRNHSAGRR
jgi:hypothetical protein